MQLAVREYGERGSLRSNFAWTFAGNVVYGAGQWAVLSLLAKLGSREMLGQYALAVAVTAPVAMLSHLNLRAVLATDVGGKHPFGDYLAVRLAATGAGLAAMAVLAWSTAGFTPLAAVIFALGAAQSAENVSDLYYGAMQRRERMDWIAQSTMARALVSAAALGIVLAITRSILPAALALAGGRIVVLLLYDRRRGSEPRVCSGRSGAFAVARAALPLGIVMMLSSFNTNLPRYAIQHHLGTPALGAFAAAASFMTAGNTVVNALGQSATPRLARYFAERSRASYLQLARHLVLIALALGAAGVAAAMVAGASILRILYSPEYTALAPLLVQVMAAAIPVYAAGILGYAVTGARVFDAQLPLFCAAAASCGFAAWLLIPRFGLAGAPMALAISACVQIVGELIVLARALRRPEPAL